MLGKKLTSKNTGTEISPASTAELLPASVSSAVINEVYEGIKDIQREAGLMGAVQSGKLIIEKFFGGDFKDWRARGAHDASLRTLAERFEKSGVRGFSVPNLSRFVAIHELNERVGVSTWKHLGVSHVRSVLALPEPEQQRLLAKAEEKEWTVVDLLKEVKKGKKKDPEDRRGRPALPAFVKGFTQLKKAVSLATSEAVDESTFATYSPELAQELLDEIEPQLEALQKLVGDVRSAMIVWKANDS